MKARLRFNIEKDDTAGLLVASWDDPEGGGITTQGKNIVELAQSIEDAIRCHFTGRTVPGEAVLHFESDPVLELV